MLGLALAFAAEILDHSVKNAEELEELLPYPLMATIPRIDLAPARGWRRLVPGRLPE